MTQDIDDLDGLVRTRIRALRIARGLSLGDLAAQAHLSQSTLSRIENGQRRLALDQLVTLARLLDTSLDQLVETAAHDVVSTPVVDHSLDSLRWQPRRDPDLAILRRRLTNPPPQASQMRAHPGHEWMVVLSGTVILLLGTRRYRMETNQSAEFPTMLPHAFGVEGGPADVLMIADRDARRGHRDEPGS